MELKAPVDLHSEPTVLQEVDLTIDELMKDVTSLDNLKINNFTAQFFKSAFGSSVPDLVKDVLLGGMTGYQQVSDLSIMAARAFALGYYCHMKINRDFPDLQLDHTSQGKVQ